MPFTPLLGRHQRLGAREDGSWIIALAVHPTVIAVRVSIPGAADRTVSTEPLPDRPDGPRYVVFTAPASATAITWTLLTADGHPVPGGTHTVHTAR